MPDQAEPGDGQVRLRLQHVERDLLVGANALHVLVRVCNVADGRKRLQRRRQRPCRRYEGDSWHESDAGDLAKPGTQVKPDQQVAVPDTMPHFHGTLPKCE
jgi:hypothetical protein